MKVDGLLCHENHNLNSNTSKMPEIPVCATYDNTLEGGIRGSKACKLRVDGCDPVTERVMIKFSSINPAHLSPMVQEIYSLLCLLNKVFGTADSFRDKTLSTGFPFETPPGCSSCLTVGREQRRSIGIAGSAALALLEGYLATDEDGSLRGRWRKRVAEYHRSNGTMMGNIERDLVIMEMIHTRGGRFKVKDIDVFFTRGYGFDNLGFIVVSNMVVKEITDICSSRGVGVKVEEMRRNWYVEKDELVLIQDMTIGDGRINLSFIQQPCTEDIDTVVSEFDIDVCRVVYNPFEEVLYADLGLVDRIKQGYATVVDLTARNGGPDSFDVAKITSTIRRMHKYHERGYIFDRLPMLRTRGAFPRNYDSDSDSD